MGLNLSLAAYNNDTIFPEGFDPIKFGMQKVPKVGQANGFDDRIYVPFNKPYSVPVP